MRLGSADLHKMPQHERAAAGIGWVPQERNIFKSLTVDENLTAVARPARARRKAEGEEGAWVIDNAKVEEVLGIPRYAVEEADKEAEIGAVMKPWMRSALAPA